MVVHRSLSATITLLAVLPTASAQNTAKAQIPPPVFPAKDRDNNHYGTVQINVEIDATGKLVKATVVKSSGWKGLDQSALNAAQRGTYKPASDSTGAPIASALTVGVDFASPYGAPEENEALLKRMLNLTCAQYLEKLAADPDERRDEGFGWAFGMPLLQFEQLYASRGKKVELLPQRTRIYRKVVKYCSSAPEISAYEAFARAVP